MRISDWSSDVCSSDLETLAGGSMVGDKIILAYLQDAKTVAEMVHLDGSPAGDVPIPGIGTAAGFSGKGGDPETFFAFSDFTTPTTIYRFDTSTGEITIFAQPKIAFDPTARSEEHTSELQSLMRNSYAVFC